MNNEVYKKQKLSRFILLNYFSYHKFSIGIKKILTQAACLAADSFYKHQYLFIMTSLTFNSQKNCDIRGSEVQQLKSKILALQSETDILNRIISINDQTLEEINELVISHLETLRNMGNHYINGLQITKGYTKTAKEGSINVYQDSISIISKMNQAISDHCDSFRGTLQSAVIDRNDDVNILKKSLKISKQYRTNTQSKEQVDCDTSIEEYTSSKAIFEVPIEVQLLKQVTDKYVQVDLANEHKHYIYEVPLQIHQIFQIPVELNQIFEVPVELNCQKMDEINRLFQVPVQINEIFEVFDEQYIPAPNIIQEIPIFNLQKAAQNKQSDQLYQMIVQLRSQIARLKEENQLLQFEEHHKFFEIPVEVQVFGDLQLLNDPKSLYSPPLQIQIQSKEQIQGMIFEREKQPIFKHAQSKIQVQTRTDLENGACQQNNAAIKTSIMMSNAIKYQPLNSHKKQHESQTLKDIKQLNLFVDKHVDCEIHASSAEDLQMRHHQFDEVPFEMEFYGDHVEIQMEVQIQTQSAQQQTQTDFQQRPQPYEKIVKIPFIKTVQVPIQVEIIRERIVKIPQLRIIQVPVQQIISKIIQIPVQINLERESIHQSAEIENYPLVLKSHNTHPIITEKIQTAQTKTIIRQVPIEVIVQKIIEAPPKIIIRQVPIQVIVQKIIQLPPIVIVKEVPIEVFVQKEVQVIIEKEVQRIVEVPVQIYVQKMVPWIREVPVEVQIEKIKQIKIVEIREVPIEVIVEKEVIRQVQKIVKVIQTKIKEVPIEVIVEKIVYVPQIKEVPVEVIIEKFIYVPQIREIPIEVQVQRYIEKVVQKYVEIPILIQIPIEMMIQKEKIVQKKLTIIKQIPTQVVIEKEIERIIQIPVQLIRQVPVQVIVQVEKIIQKIKIVKQIVQVPVIMMISQSNNELSPIQNKNHQVSSLGYYSADKIKQQQQWIDLIAHDEQSGDIGRLRLQSNEPLLQNEEYKSSALEMPVGLPEIQIRQIPVQLIMINQIATTKNIPKIYQLPTEVIIVEQKEKIVYVQKIVEVIIQKIVEVDKIIEIPIEVIIQRPIYIDRQKIVEIPIEVEVEKEVIVYRNSITEIPIQVILQNQQIVAQQPQNIVLQSKTFSFDKQHNRLQQLKEGEQLQKIKQQSQAENMERVSSFHLINDKTGMIQRHYEFPLTLDFLEKNKDIIVDISHMMDNQNQYEQIIIEFPSNHINGVYMDASVQACEYIEQIQSSSIRLNSRNVSIQCADTGVQTVMIQQRLKIMQIPIQMELEEENMQKDLQKKYRNHIDDLKEKYQCQINELNKSMIALQSIIVEINQGKEVLQQKIQESAFAKQSLLSKYENAIQQVQQLKKLLLQEKHQSSNRIYEVPVQVTSFNRIYQIPIEVILQKQGVDTEIQTQDIEIEHFGFIELPIYVEKDEYALKEAYFEDLQAQFQQQQLIDLQNSIKEDKIGNIELEESPVKVILNTYNNSQQIQTDLSLNQYEDIVILRNTFDNPYETNQPETHLINQVLGQNIIQQVTFSNHTFKQLKQQYSQTDSVPVADQYHFYELPVEIVSVAQTDEASIQTQNIQMSQSSNKSSSSDEEYDEQILLRTERNSNIYSKENKTETNFHKRKPYSDYFRSRIFEIPIELNVKNDHNNIEIQTFNKKLESIEVQTQVSQRELDGLSQIWQSRQKQAILSRLTLVPAFETVALLLEQPNTPKKSMQNKIARLGSELSNPGAYQNFSHAQSLTPNQLDGSVTYQKFPQPTININNISLIKKSSIHSEYNKFLGSLDMRQDLLNHDSAIASVRLNNKRLMGFDKQQSSSEEGDIHNLSREMIIEQNETINSRDINRIQTPNLEPHDLNFSEYATLKQKFYEPEEYKRNYQEMYQHSQNQVQGLKLKLGHKIQEVNQLKIEIDQEICRYQQQIRKLKEQIVKIEKESFDQYNIAQNYRIKVEETTEQKVKLQEKQEILVERWERLRDQSEKLQNSTNKEIQRLRQIITEKLTQIKQLKSDQYHQKEVYQLQLVEFRQIIHQKTETIDTLEQQLQRRSDRIDQLLMLIQEMRKNISNHASQSDTAAIYEQQFVRVKQGFEQEKNELNYQIFQLKQQNQQLKNRLNDEAKKCQQLQQNIAYLQKQLDEAKHDYSSLHHLKSELENNYMEGVKNLNQQLEEMKEIVREKQEFIYRINPSLEKMAPNMSNSAHQQSPVRVQYLSKETSQITHDSSKGLEAYTKRLEGLIKKYERIIIDNQNTIEDQQDKVYEYLKDALQKQQQAQGLYLKLVDYENTVNKVLVEKVTLEVQNKRLSKQMELSQKKLSVLGNRLIEVARQRAEYDSDDDVYYQ